MDESVRRFTKSLEEDILKVINDQLDYMEQLCVGSEHQGSMFGIQNRRENGRQTLQNLHKELDAMVPAKEEPDPDTKMEGAVSEDDKDDGSFEDVVMSGGSDA